MLKKGVNKAKFHRPFSAMRLVLEAVENGADNKFDITSATKLPHGKVESAIKNLMYIGAIVRGNDSNNRSVFTTPGRQGPVALCWMGVRSVFDVATTIDNQMSSTPIRTDK